MTLNILWWVAFFVLGLALQQALPGTDVLVAGLFLALQERRPFQLAVVLLALILVQEGVGTFWHVRSRQFLVITPFFVGADVRDEMPLYFAQRLCRLGALRRHCPADDAAGYSFAMTLAGRKAFSQR